MPRPPRSSPRGAPSGVRRRVLGGMAAWALGLGLAAVVVHPESCAVPSAAEAHAAAERAVGWLVTNQEPDGQWLYRYDRRNAEDLGGYNVVRHAGVMLSLYQADGAGIDGARDAADRGLRWIEGGLKPLGGGQAVAFGSVAETGTTALLVDALIERREVTGDERHDVLIADLGRFLVSQVTADGAVVAARDADADEPVAGSRSPFFTGEALWALRRLERAFPDGGWSEPADRVAAYVTTERDDVEPRFPPVSDHWTAYALGEAAENPAVTLTAAEGEYARRQAGLFAVQARFESQRRGEGITGLTRGPIALAAGVGTLGEGLAGIWRAGGADETLADVRTDAAEDLRCVMGLLVARQVKAADVREGEAADPIVGAWFRLGVTQMDDQQHALSALLAAEPVLEES